MSLDKSFYINTGKDGILGETSEDDVKKLVAGLADKQKVVLHFHGGLVRKESAKQKAEQLKDVYLEAGAHPVFFVWESGLLETIRHNLHEINKEEIFNRLLRRVLQRAVGKLTGEGGKGIGGEIVGPTEIELSIELGKREAGQEPYADLDKPAAVEDLTEEEEERFKKDLEEDQEFQEELQAIADTAHPDAQVTEKDGSKGVTVLERRSARTLMSPEVVEELKADTAETGGKGVFESAAFLVRVGKILFRVIRRFVRKRDHGLYITVVEEILRELYVANLGAGIWQMMKKETADTFADPGGGPARGGWVFVRELRSLLAAGHRPEITLVGHSTGAVFICNLLRSVDKMRQAGEIPQDFKFKNVIFLAPACDFELFAEEVGKRWHLVDGFRMFTMTDKNECDDTLVPVIYTRSLLYFVSGVVERDKDGDGWKSAFDRPIVGMERYFKRADVYTDAPIAAVRKFLTDGQSRVIWSVADGAAGLSSNTLSHGGFDDLADQQGNKLTTLASVQHIIAHGA
jgi:hypothetical protein